MSSWDKNFHANNFPCDLGDDRRRFPLRLVCLVIWRLIFRGTEWRVISVGIAEDCADFRVGFELCGGSGGSSLRWDGHGGGFCFVGAFKEGGWCGKIRGRLRKCWKTTGKNEIFREKWKKFPGIIRQSINQSIDGIFNQAIHFEPINRSINQSMENFTIARLSSLPSICS